MRKGQYLAIESILSVTLGIALAVGTVTIFNDYRESVLSTGASKQVDTVESEIISTIFTLKGVKNGEMTVDLPEKVGGNSYDIVLDGELRVNTPDETYTKKVHGLQKNYQFNGSADGGSVKIFKRENKFVLRANQ